MKPAAPFRIHRRRQNRWAAALIPLSAMLSGCFYPPQQKPLAAKSIAVTLDRPYDLAWDAVQAVVANNGFRVITANPNDGTIEAQAIGKGFTLEDADCGKLRGAGAKIDAEPDFDASAVYDLRVEAKEPQLSTVTIAATFTAPLHVPLHPVTDIECVSRGRQEARLLGEIKAEAPKHRRAIEHAAPDILKNPS